MSNYYLKQVEIELKIRNYSPRTIKSYIRCLQEYFNYTKNKNIGQVNINLIKKFLLQKHEKKYSPQTINLYLNAIKFFYRDIIKAPQKINLKFAKRTKKLPIVLSRQEIKKIISSIKNIKHKLLISLSYGAGLRVSEIINLKIQDVSIQELILHIKQSKNKINYFWIIFFSFKAEI